MKEDASTLSSSFFDRKLQSNDPYDSEDLRKNGKDPSDLLINWMELEPQLGMELVGTTAASIMLNLKKGVYKHTTQQTMNQNQPSPDLYLIRLSDQPLIRRTTTKDWGADTHTLRMLVRSLIQAKIIYGVQHVGFTRKQHEALEILNRRARRVVTGLPNFTLIDTLQAHADPNTIGDLLHEARLGQHLRLSRSRPGRSILRLLGLLPVEGFPHQPQPRHRGACRTSPPASQHHPAQKVAIPVAVDSKPQHTNAQLTPTDLKCVDTTVMRLRTHSPAPLRPLPAAWP
ncbi:hypothetical protein HPB47_019713 [Ixodes persulcatus]|uniref:Uncharacterized protein n=1 Tax=Ixodes persulcatus TaxID=34615 RepID=A0AC60QHG2_IXOPE|nr:hypothetical protein HPB47_019713 [Ixodes persulcatus]